MSVDLNDVELAGITADYVNGFSVDSDEAQLFAASYVLWEGFNLVPIDQKRAMEAARIGTEKGFALLQMRHAFLIYKDNPDRKKLIQADRLASRAYAGVKTMADTGNPFALQLIGFCNSYGVGVPRNIAEGEKYRDAAAAKGEAVASCEKACAYTKAKFRPIGGNLLETQNFFTQLAAGPSLEEILGRNVLQKFAEMGMGSAQFDYSTFCIEGIGGPVDLDMAENALLSLAEQNWPDIGAFLGNFYVGIHRNTSNEDVAIPTPRPVDHEQAFIWYARAARDGNLSAMKAMVYYCENRLAPSNENCSLANAFIWVNEILNDPRLPAKDREAQTGIKDRLLSKSRMLSPEEAGETGAEGMVQYEFLDGSSIGIAAARPSSRPRKDGSNAAKKHTR